MVYQRHWNMSVLLTLTVPRIANFFRYNFRVKKKLVGWFVGFICTKSKFGHAEWKRRFDFIYLLQLEWTLKVKMNVFY